MRNKLLEYLPLMHYRKVWFYGFVLFLLLFVFVLLTSQVVLSWHDKQQKDAEIAEMHEFLKEWHQKSDILNAAAMRPVDIAQIDQVQTQLLFRQQTCQLNLISMKDSQKGKQANTNGHLYTMEFTGSYENTIKFLQNFHAQDALVGISHLKMDIQNNLLHTRLTYKIYTK